MLLICAYLSHPTYLVLLIDYGAAAHSKALQKRTSPFSWTAAWRTDHWGRGHVEAMRPLVVSQMESPGKQLSTIQ